MTAKYYFIGIIIGILPMSTFALPQDPVSNPSKNEWIAEVKAQVSIPVCRSFFDDESIATQMTAGNINFEKCLSLLPTITDSCIQEYDARLPAIIDDAAAEKWGKLLGECIGNHFAKQYLYSDKSDKAR